MSSIIDVGQIPLALYIHIPWCIKKCPYCDFNSHTLPVARHANEKLPINDINSATIPAQVGSIGASNIAVNTNTGNSIVKVSRHEKHDGLTGDYFEQYVSALIADVNAQLPLTQGRQITAIFIGGGTPSLLPIEQYQRLFDHLRTVLSFAHDIEITMEANPGTLEHAPFAEYLKVGINRLSLGVQSFSNTHLRALGRIHDANQAIKATKSAREAGFERINIDLMHGLPEQTLDDALQDILLANRAGATHLSWYQLTIEPNTVFYRNKPILPQEDELSNIETQGTELLQRLGYHNYEISAWVKQRPLGEDRPCRHNVNYWQFGDYLAIGAGAHGKVSIDKTWLERFHQYSGDIPKPGIYRYSKSRLPKDYLNYETYPKQVNFSAVEQEEIASEFMLNALRLTEGVSVKLFSHRTGQDIDTILPILTELRNKGLLVDDRQIIKPTTLGRRYLNTVLAHFMS